MVPAELFTSETGLLPLVWAEILYAVRNDIYTFSCEICGKWFPIGSGVVKKRKDKQKTGYKNYNQKYCPECRSEAERRSERQNRPYKNKKASKKP
jgi:endogenous inhibitor of DNA gyrase (YacG/DUF329 family)